MRTIKVANTKRIKRKKRKITKSKKSKYNIKSINLNNFNIPELNLEKILIGILLLIILVIAISSVLVMRKNNSNTKATSLEVKKIIENLNNKEEFDKYSCEETCENCKFFPVSKERSLNKDSKPILEKYESGERVFFMTKETLQGLNDLKEDASLNGIGFYLISAYRAFEEQQGLFNTYIQNEMDKGLNLEEATEKANEYSARPGQSEHQLGTTIDVNCNNCEPFAFNEESLEFYSYINENAHRFGFVVSYPENTKSETGYTYEPWHLRYLGKEVSEVYVEELNTREGKLSVEKFLEEKCEYLNNIN